MTISLRFSSINFLVLCFSSVLIFGQTSEIKTSKNPSELNLSVGLSSLRGDVNSKLLKNSNYSIGYRKGINSVWSAEVKINYTRSFGQDVFPTYGLEAVSPSLFQGYDNVNPYFYSFKNIYSSFDINSLFELSNLGFKLNANLNYYMGIGVGFGNSNTTLNLKGDEGQVYDNLLNVSSFGDLNDPNTKEGRSKIANALEGYYDDTYETPGPKKNGQFRLGDETNVFFHTAIIFGMSYRVNTKFNLGLEYQTKFINSDLLDGKDQNFGGENDNNDILSMLSIKVAYNLNGSAGNEPKYWTNDWDLISDRIDTLENKLPLLLEDTDGDGIVDVLDREPNTLSDCPVDAHGVLLDSDKDGIPNCQDSSPFGKNNSDANTTQNISSNIESELENLSKELQALKDSFLLYERDLKSLRDRTANLEVKRIYFNKGLSELSKQDVKLLFELSEFLKRNDKYHLLINGYASEEGEGERNILLSNQRAEAVKSILLNVFQINSERIKISSFGSSQKVFSGKSIEYNYLDRRADLIVIKK